VNQQKRFRKVWTILGVWLVLVVMLLSIGIQAAAYDSEAAAEYGEYFAYGVCSDGHYWVGQFVSGVQISSTVWNYTPSTSVGVVDNDLDNMDPQDWRGVDCAHFVSCCIGSPPSYAGHSGGGLDIPSRGGAYGEPSANSLVNWLLDHGGTVVNSLNYMSAGDVIGYDWDRNGSINHVALYLGNNMAAAHSHSWTGDWHLGHDAGSFSYKFIHIGGGTTPPPPPTHVSPANSSTINTLTPTFTWNDVSNADYYGLYISEPPWNEDHLVFNSRTDYGPIHGTSFDLPSGKLAPGVTYYWNMQAYNSEGGWGGFSFPSWGFTTTNVADPTMTNQWITPTAASPGDTIEFHYTINNPNSSNMNVTLGAQIRKSGSTGWTDDMAHDKTVALTSGSNSEYRWFTVPSSASPGNYDLRWVIFEPGNSSNRYSIQTVYNGLEISQPTGSLRVTISPQAAVNAGAQWRVKCGLGTWSSWYNSGYTKSGLPVGSYTVEYKDISGWTKPGNDTGTIYKNQTVTESGSYTPDTGSLQVTISPQGAITAGAQWQVIDSSGTTSSWYNSGYTKSSLPVGSYTVKYKDISGWTKPGNDTGTIYKNQTVTESGSYTPDTGSLQVTISPQGAITAGAKWRVKCGSGSWSSWYNNGYTKSGLPVGSYTVEYKDISGWSSPSNDSGTIQKSQTATESGAYTQDTGSLRVTISPQGAINAGAQWRVKCGSGTWSSWYNSGYTKSGLPVGSYTVEYKDISGWTKPSNDSGTIQKSQTATESGAYTQDTGSLRVTISPQGAINAGAQWRVKCGSGTWSSWYNSGYTKSGLPVGSYTVEYKDVSGWTKPGNDTGTIQEGQTMHEDGAYICSGCPPCTPGNPTPTDGATLTSNCSSVTLQWNCTGGNAADSYDVYFGTNSNPTTKVASSITQTSYSQSIQNSTHYYWKVIAKKSGCVDVSGPVWDFTTSCPECPACTPGNPTPANNATGISTTATLQWGCSGGNGVDSYDVYFGTSTSPGKVGNSSSMSYNPGTLQSCTDYYWKVVAKKTSCNDVSGPEWHFKTVGCGGTCDNRFQRTMDMCVVPGGTFNVQVTLQFDESFTGLVLDEQVPSGWTVTPVDNGEATYKPSSVEWLWISVAVGDTKTVTYTVTVPQGTSLGMYTVSGMVKSSSPALSAVVCGNTEIEVADSCGKNIAYTVAHWVGSTTDGSIDPSDPCEISTAQILVAIPWWALPDAADPDLPDLVCSNDWPISTDEILALIPFWAQETCIDDPACEDRSLKPRNGSAAATATRVIDPDSVDAVSGGTVEVTVSITAQEAITGLVLDEQVPSGWTVTPVDNGGATYKPSSVEWLWISVAAGETKTVTYDVQIPAGETPNTYTISGVVKSGMPPFENSVVGENEVSVGSGADGCWSQGTVRIQASGSGSDTSNWFGVDPNGSDCFDIGLDIEQPAPFQPPYTDLWFELDPSCSSSAIYNRDIKASVLCDEVKSWAMKVVDNGDGQQMTLSWDLSGTQFGNCLNRVVLTDLTSGTVTDMAGQSQYTYTKQSNPETREFTITVDCSTCQEVCTDLVPTGWHMMTIPGDLCGACGIDEAGFGDLCCALSDDIDPCFIFRYDPIAGGYVMVPSGDDCTGVNYHAGMGFWVRTYNDPVHVCADVNFKTEETCIPLQTGWNQIGNPFNFEVALSNIAVKYQGNEVSLGQAQANGWVSMYLFGYDTTAGGYGMLDPTSGVLEPWTGYWMRAYVDCEVCISPIAAPPAPPSALLRPQALGLSAIDMPPPPPNFAKQVDEDVVTQLTVSNEPNPIRSRHTTTFKVQGKGAELVQAIRVEIYNQAGQKMFTQDINAKELEWHTNNDTGELLANGVYLYQVWVEIAGTWYPTGVYKLAVVR